MQGDPVIYLSADRHNWKNGVKADACTHIPSVQWAADSTLLSPMMEPPQKKLPLAYLSVVCKVQHSFLLIIPTFCVCLDIHVFLLFCN